MILTNLSDLLLLEIMQTSMTRGLKQRVEFVLSQFPQTRDNDAKLILRLYEEYYHLTSMLTPTRLFEMMDYDKPDDIVRIRRQIQNREGRYLPSVDTSKKRQQHVEQAREVLGYHNQ